MNFENRLKGSITQVLMKALLDDAGYQIVPLGVEEVIREVKNLSAPEYNNLDLPSVLRKMPDFFVADKNFEKTWLTEVKYRRKWDACARRALKSEIEDQVKNWQPVHLVLFLGERVRETDTPASILGVLRLTHVNGQLLCSWSNENHAAGSTEENETTWDDIEWDNFHRFQDVFRDVAEQWGESTLIKALSLLESLKKLDSFE